MQKIKNKIADFKTTRLQLHVEIAAGIEPPLARVRLGAIERLIVKYEALLTPVGKKP